MDVNATLESLREWAAGADCGIGASDAMELFQALDQWILRGGYLPSAWERNKK